MISYKLSLRPPGFDSPVTTLTVEGRACCAHTLSKIANNAAIIYDWSHCTSMQAENGVDHAEHPSTEQLVTPSHDPDDNDNANPNTEATID